MFGDRMLRQETLKPKSVGATLSRFSNYFRPYWLVLTLVAVLMTVNAYTQVIGPRLIGQAVDCFLAPAAFAGAGEEGRGLQLPAETDLQTETDSQANCWWAPEVAMGNPSRDVLLRGILNITLIITGYYLVGSATGGLMFFSMSWTGHNVLRALRVRLFTHLHRLSLGFYTRNETGDLMSRITNDSDTIQQVVGFALVQVLSSVVLIIWIIWADARSELGLRTHQPERRTADGPGNSVVQQPGAQGLSRHPPEHRRRQRGTGGGHLRRARGPGLQPRGNQLSSSSGKAMRSTATPISRP